MCGFPTKACDNVRSKRGSVAFAQQVCFGMCLDLLLVSVLIFSALLAEFDRPAATSRHTAFGRVEEERESVLTAKST